MKSICRVYARLGITLAIAILVSWVVPPFVDRRDFVDAVSNYEKNPTLENGVALARQHDENRRVGLLIRLGVGSLVIENAISQAAFIMERIDRKWPEK